MDNKAPLVRSDLLMTKLDKFMKIVEIGPSYNPVAPKSEGWRTTIVDYASQSDLKNIYKNHVLADQIEEVDVVWNGGAISDAFRPETLGSFDALIASHVIEHTPDIVRFLMSCRSLLKTDGRLLLVVPDKRQCFDFFKPTSTSADAFEAFSQHRSRHLKRTQFLHVAFAVTAAGKVSWGWAPPSGLVAAHPFSMARTMFNAVSEDPKSRYTDCHAWFFTPASFELLVLDLRAMDLIDLDTEYVSPPLGSEFVAFLRPRLQGAISPEELATKRMQLLKRGLMELRDQADMLLSASQ